MTPEFFQKQAERLISAYGEANYPDPCLKALYSELKHISETRFEKAITRVLATYVSPKYPPGVDKIEKIISEIREDAIEVMREANKKAMLEGMAAIHTTVSNEEVSFQLRDILKKI